MKNLIYKNYGKILLIAAVTLSPNAYAGCEFEFDAWWNDYGELFESEAECLAEEPDPSEALTASPLTISLTSGNTYTFKDSDFNLQDGNNTVLDVTAIQYTGSSLNGTLYVDSNDNNVFDAGNEVIGNGNLLDSLNNGQLKYVADEGATYDDLALYLYNGSSSAIYMGVTVTISAPDNVAPAIDSIIGDYTVDEDFTQFNIPIQISDIDSDDLTLTASAADTSIVTLLPTWTPGSIASSSYAEALSLTIVPKDNVHGSTTITLTLTDESNHEVTKDFKVTVNSINDAPAISGVPSTTVNQNLEYSFIPEVNDVDNDETQSFAINNKPSWLAFNESTGKLSGTPSQSHVGIYENITITVTDSANAFDILPAFNLSVLNVNDAPVINIPSVLVTNEDVGATLTYTATDLDGDEVSVVSTEPAIGTVQVNTTTKQITYTPDDNQNGTDSFTLTFKDGNGAKDTKVINVTINAVNDAPSITMPTTITTPEDIASTISYTATDADGDVITVASTEASKGTVSINQVDKTITYSPTENENGTDSFILTFADSNGAKLEKEISVTVTAVNDGSTVTISQTLVTEEDTLKTLSYDVTDEDGDIVTITLATAPSLGFVDINAESKQVTYTPNENKNGADSFTLLFDDGQGFTVEKSIAVTIEAVNDVIEISGEPLATTYQYAPYHFSPSVVDHDNVKTKTFTITNKPEWLTFDDSTGELTGTPNDIADYNDITISVNDGTDTVALPAFSISVIESIVKYIDTEYAYIWNDKIGWISLKESQAQMEVYPDHLEGYLWSTAIGWIELGNEHQGKNNHTYVNTTTESWGINVSASGELSGYAWNEKIGWISFNESSTQVNIDLSTGIFSGYAWNDKIGWISFSGDNYSVKIPKQATPVTPTPKPVPDPDTQEEISDAQSLETGTELKETTETEDSFEVTISKGDEEETVGIPKQDSEGNIVTQTKDNTGVTFSTEETAVTYNNNGTTATTTKGSDDEVTTTVSKVTSTATMTGSGTTKVVVDADDLSDVQQDNEVKTTSIISETDKAGHTEVTVENSVGDTATVNAEVPGTKTVIDQDGTVKMNVENNDNSSQVTIASDKTEFETTNANSGKVVTLSLSSATTLTITMRAAVARTILPLGPIAVGEIK